MLQRSLLLNTMLLFSGAILNAVSEVIAFSGFWLLGYWFTIDGSADFGSLTIGLFFGYMTIWINGISLAIKQRRVLTLLSKCLQLFYFALFGSIIYQSILSLGTNVQELQNVLIILFVVIIVLMILRFLLTFGYNRLLDYFFDKYDDDFILVEERTSYLVKYGDKYQSEKYRLKTLNLFDIGIEEKRLVSNSKNSK